jgi:hypothetical protein
VFVGSGYFAYNGNMFFNKGDTLLGYIIGILYLAVWLFFLTGVAVYLIFFTRNTFRMYYEPQPDYEDEDDEDSKDNKDNNMDLIEGELP